MAKGAIKWPQNKSYYSRTYIKQLAQYKLNAKYRFLRRGRGVRSGRGELSVLKKKAKKRTHFVLTVLIRKISVGKIWTQSPNIDFGSNFHINLSPGGDAKYKNLSL